MIYANLRLWIEFRALDPGGLASIMREPVLIDLRNIYLPDEIAQTSLLHHSISRPGIQPQ